MAFYKLFQLNTGVPAPSTIQSNTIQVYSNASGALITVQSGKSPVLIGSVLTGALLNSVTVFTTGSAGTVAQQVAGNSGIWIPVTLSGVRYAVPAFIY
jgi:hypothetical protein